MKNIIKIFLTALMFFFISCAENIPEESIAMNNDYSLNNYSHLDISSVFFTDLEYESLNIRNTNLGIIWNIQPIGKPMFDYNQNQVDEQSMVLMPVDIVWEELTPGMGVPFYIGNDDWKDYKFSFDFYMGDNDGIDFAIYNETRLVESDFPDSMQYYWFTLKSNGQLIFNTTFGHNWYYINKIVEFDPNVWNYVEVKFIDNKLNILINGISAGIVNEADEAGNGGVAIGGAVGSMFKNINVLSN